MKTIQVIGPYFTNYSLAKVNRGLALALGKIQDEYKVSLYCDKDKIDWWPSDDELKQKPELSSMVLREKANSDIVIYNNFPKSINSPHGLEDLPGIVKLMYIAWEESVYPRNWVEEINKNVHGVMAATTFVKKILRDSGVVVPIEVIQNAMDDNLRQPPTKKYPLSSSKEFKFLHVSTAKQRKGVDVLIKSYFSEFSKEDDVVLVVKSFPGPDNNVDELIFNLKNENSPEVVHINNPDLTEEELRNLINTCDCGVYPSRAEGFGLPILESMFHKIPVIATNYSGYLDFLDEDSGYMIDYKLEYVKDSEIVNLGGKWAEPDSNHLSSLMRKLYELKKYENLGGASQSDEFEKELEARNQKVRMAKLRADGITWENSARKALEFIKVIEQASELKNKNIGVLSFVNDETGIASYTRDLFSKIEGSFNELYYFGNSDIADRNIVDTDKVKRLWESGSGNFDSLIEFLSEKNISIFHIQYHSGTMFSIADLDLLIKRLKTYKIKTYITLHAVRGSSFDFISESKELKNADKVLIHNKPDFEYAKETLENVELFNHPTVEFSKRNKQKLKSSLGISESYPIVSTHGLLNKNKGVPNIVEAVNILKKEYPDILLMSLSAVSANNIHSQALLEEVNGLVKKYNLENNIRIFNKFLEDEVVEVILQCSDINVFAYSDVGESASGAVRKGLASFNPVIVTDIIQFDEFEDEVWKIADNKPQTIADGIRELIEDEDKKEEAVENAKRFIQENSFDKKSIETLLIYNK